MAHFGGETAWNPKGKGIPGLSRNPVRKVGQTEHFQQFQRVAQAVTPQLLPVRDLSGEGFDGYHRRLERPERPCFQYGIVTCGRTAGEFQE